MVEKDCARGCLEGGARESLLLTLQCCHVLRSWLAREALVVDPVYTVCRPVEACGSRNSSSGGPGCAHCYSPSETRYGRQQRRSSSTSSCSSHRTLDIMLHIREAAGVYSNWSIGLMFKFLKQILAGLTFIHRHQKCHLDLKSENILLNKDGPE